MNELELKGEWWTPGNYEDRVGGVARYDPNEGTTLNLYSQLSDGLGDYKKVERILGISDGENITLHKCYRNGYNMSIGSSVTSGTSTYSVDRLIRGNQWYQNNNNPHFEKLIVAFPLVDVWTESYIPVDSDTENGPGSTTTVSLSLPEDTPRKTVPEFDVELYPRSNLNTNVYGNWSMEITQHFVIESRRPDVPISDWLDYIMMFRNLVSLGTDEKIHPLYIKGMPDRDGTSDDYLDLYVQSSSYKRESKHPNHLMFLTNDVDGGLETLIENWYDLWDDLRVVLTSYFNVVYSDSMDIENQFLSLMRCLEGYYLRRHENAYMDEQAWDDIVCDLKDATMGSMSNIYDTDEKMKNDADLPESLDDMMNLDDIHDIDNDLKDRLSDYYYGGNRHSLNKIVKNLVRDYESILESVNHNPIDQERTIVLTRHHLTHQKKTKHYMVAEDHRLMEIIWSVRQLIEAILMREMGVEEDQIKEKLERKYGPREIMR